MGSNTETPTTNQLAVVTDTNVASIMLNVPLMAEIDKLAVRMASAKNTLPAHLQKNEGDCWAVIMQAIQWKMNPFVVAQKTHLVQGKLGYEAQLVNAVVNSSGVTKDRFHYEWFGDWDRIMGRFKEVTSKKKTNEDTGEPLTYRVPDWHINDEKGLGIKVWATIKGEDVPRELTLLLMQCRVRNSPLWADDPRQQIAYLAVKRWVRLYCPDVLLGVYTPDELAPEYGMERDVTPAARTEVTDQPKEKPYPDADLQANLPKWRKLIEDGKQVPGSIINALKTKHFTLTDEQVQAIHNLAPITGEAEVVDEPAAQPADTQYADPSVQEFFENADA